jgi:hypothetical protein
MKPSAITKTHFQTIPVANNWESLKTENRENPFSFQDFTIPPAMLHQEVEPPAYIWDKIASVLDAQDRIKAEQPEPAHISITASHARIPNNRRFILFAALVMLTGAIILSVI